ncbi:hypothetical protein Taro_051589, partial [Colocasia esculenta]|nr:hypothetical protein [Colocasia esculenta]
VVPMLERMSRGVRTRMSSRPQHPRILQFFLHHHLYIKTQAPTLVPKEQGHGGPSIMERFKRMVPPSFKGESQPLLAESWMREIEKIFRAIRCAEEDKVNLATYMLQALSAVCRQESEMEQYLEEKKASQRRSVPPFQRQDRKKVAYQSPQCQRVVSRQLHRGPPASSLVARRSVLTVEGNMVVRNARS